MNKTLTVAGMLLLSGCSLMNPYESSFSCPETGTGKCVSVQTAYQEATAPVTVMTTDTTTETTAGNSTPENRERPGAAENRYRTALCDTFPGLLKEPVTPVVAPPRTMRVLILPYTGQDNELNMLRYVYFFVDEPRWLLGDTITSGEEE